MIKLLTRISFIFSILLCSLSLLAGQFVKIERIDVSSIAYPKVQVFLRINGIHESDITAPDEKILTFYEDGSRVDDSITVTKQIDTEQYLYLVFSIDSSKSISKKFLNRIKSSARDIVRSIGPQDKIAVYRFNDHVSLLNTFTQNTDQIIKNINSVKRHGKKTLLYSAIYDSIELLDTVKQINKKIIVFTDGKDEGSNVSEEDIIQKARNSGIPIYFISFKNSNEIRIMAHISKLTGGKLIYSTSHDDVAGMYRTILSCMNNRYSAAYQTHLKKDGMNHTIEVRLNNGDIRDQDSKLIRLDTDIISRDLFSFNGYVCLVIIFFLIIVLFIVIIYFLNREKRFFQEQYKIEKRLLLEKTLVPGELKGDRTDTEQHAISFEDEECHYANAWLYQKDGPEMGKKYLIQSQETTIGCGNGNNIVINDESISVHHAKIKNINGIYHMFDLISDHGTYLNGKKLLRPKALHDWDEIKIGRIILIFRGAMHPR